MKIEFRINRRDAYFISTKKLIVFLRDKKWVIGVVKSNPSYVVMSKEEFGERLSLKLRHDTDDKEESTLLKVEAVNYLLTHTNISLMELLIKTYRNDGES